VVSMAKASAEIEKIIAEKDKAIEERAKIKIDAGLGSRQMRATLFSTILIPVASLLTVVVTLFISNQQIRSSAEVERQKLGDLQVAREADNWKSFQIDLEKTSADQLYSSPTFMAKLRAFKRLGSHNDELADIVKKLMIGVTSRSAFEELWKLQIEPVTPSNYAQVIELAREKRKSAEGTQTTCREQMISAAAPKDDQWSHLGICSPNIKQDAIDSSFPDPAKKKSILALRQLQNDLNGTILFLSERISSYLREEHNKTKGSKSLVLSGIWLVYTNLKDVDLSKTEMIDTLFGTVNLEGARLANTSGSDFAGSTWWDAESVDQKLLPYLIAYYYPKMPNVLYPTGYVITREQYAAKIARLCTDSVPICSNKCLRFEKDPDSGLPECRPSTQ